MTGPLSLPIRSFAAPKLMSSPEHSFVGLPFGGHIFSPLVRGDTAAWFMAGCYRGGGVEVGNCHQRTYIPGNTLHGYVDWYETSDESRWCNGDINQGGSTWYGEFLMSGRREIFTSYLGGLMGFRRCAIVSWTVTVVILSWNLETEHTSCRSSKRTRSKGDASAAAALPKRHDQKEMRPLACVTHGQLVYRSRRDEPKQSQREKFYTWITQKKCSLETN